MSARDAVGKILASVVRVDRSAFDISFTLRSSLGVAIALLGAFATGNALLAVAAAIGAMNTGFASLQGVYRTRVGIMVMMAFAMAVSTLAGSIAAHSIVLEVLFLALWGALYGLVSSIGMGASVIGLNATIALVIFSSLPMTPGDALHVAAFVLLGGAVQILLLVASWPLQRYPEERHALADAFRSLARYAETIDCVRPAVPPITTLTAVRDALSDPRPFGRRMTFAAFQTLLDEAERLRATLGRIVATSCTAYLPHRDLVVTSLDAIADALDKAHALENDERYARLETDAGDPIVAALLGQLRATWRGASAPLTGVGLHAARLPSLQWSELRDLLDTVRANATLRSSFGRHALRLGVTLAVVGAIAHLVPLQRGYWMTLTAALVLRPDFTTTFMRGVARIIGTLLGVALATAIVLLLPTSPQVSLMLALVFATIGYGVIGVNYALYTITITAYVVFILALIGYPERAAVTSRMLATLAGGTIAMITYGLWPTWESRQTRTRLEAWLAADRLYLRSLLAALIEPKSYDAATVRKLRDDVWQARVAADASVERMVSEPHPSDDIPRDVALGIMAASQRLGLATLTLSTICANASAPMPELVPFATALETAFASIDALLRGEIAPRVNERLRESHTAARATGELRIVLDMIADSVNTIADILRDGHAAKGT